MKNQSTFLGILLFLFSSSCVALHEQRPQKIEPFNALFERDLSEFELLLATERHFGLHTERTYLGEDLLALARCVPLPNFDIEESSGSLGLARQLVRVEDYRRLRLIADVRAQRIQNPWHQGTVHSRFTSQTFFQRKPAAIPDHLVRWPATTEETWPDERPAPVEIDYQCAQLMEREAALRGLPEDEPLLFAEWFALEEALTIKLTEEEREQLAPLMQALFIHRADLLLRLSTRELSERDTFLYRRALASTREDLVRAVAEPVDTREATSSYAAAIRLYQLADGNDWEEELFLALEHLRSFDIPAIAEAADYLFVRESWLRGDWPGAASSELLPVSSPYHSAHAYFALTAHRYLGQRDRFLALGREALKNRRRPGTDPFLGGLYREVLQELVLYDSDLRTLEILEELGPRAQLRERQIELAEIAIDFERPALAEALIVPVLAATDDARQRPRLLAILALAAFQNGEATRFKGYLDALASRPEVLQEAIPRQRRATFFANQDQELARVLRAMLPMMAEWGDDPRSRQERQFWLQEIVTSTQVFLRSTPESRVSSTLTELYELASQLLEDHPRGYAQRVGRDAEDASPLVLGTVSLQALPPVHDAPQPQLRAPLVDSLLFIPSPSTPQRFVHDLVNFEETTGEDQS